MNNKKQKQDSSPKSEITRKEAIIKVGKFAALTAASMLILNPPKAHAGSSPIDNPPVW